MTDYMNRQGEQVGYTIPDESTHFPIDGYEYGVQYRYEGSQEWKMAVSNRFNGWYPSERSAKNALAQLKAPRWGYYSQNTYEYRLVRRPFGATEVVDG